MCLPMWAQLAPPGEYDWTRASFVPLESTIQTANRSLWSFLHSSRQKVHILTMGCSSPKIARCHGGSGPHLIHGSQGPPESSTQTASRSVQPFLQGSLVWQTDRPRHSVCNNRPHLRTYLRTSNGDAVYKLNRLTTADCIKWTGVEMEKLWLCQKIRLYLVNRTRRT